MSNIELLTLISMYQNGSINKGENISATFESLNHDYYIDLNRKNTSLWKSENSFKYQCELVFKNNLNIELFKMIINEDDIIRLLDSVYSYMEFNMSDINIYFDTYNPYINGYYVFSFKNIKDNIQFIVSIYNSLYNTIYQKLNIQFNEDKLTEFLEMIYYVFLIDLDSEDSFLVNPDFLC